MSMSYHMRVYALQRKSTAFYLISIYLVAQGSVRMLQFKKISLICNNWRSLQMKHTFIMMKLYDYFPRWRVELKWWRIVALRTFIGCRSVHGSGARRACLLPAACAARLPPPWSAFLKSGVVSSSCQRPQGRAAPFSAAWRTLIFCSTDGMRALLEKISQSLSAKKCRTFLVSQTTQQ